MIDIDNDGIIGANEYRFNCITRVAVESIQVVDDAYNKLTDVSINIRLCLSIQQWVVIAFSAKLCSGRHSI